MKKLLLTFSLFLIVFSCMSQTVQIDNGVYVKLNKAFKRTTLKRTATIIIKNDKIAVYKTSDEDGILSVEFVVKNGELSTANYEVQGAQSFEKGRILWHADNIVKYASIGNRFGRITSVYFNGKLIKEIESE